MTVSDIPTRIDHFTGDATGLAIPAHAAALRADGADFLTRAFRAFGSLGPDNSVARIAAIELCPGGSTGAKLFLRVEYAKDEPGVPRELFVKFSRDFTDARRDDRGRWEMRPEVPFAALSRMPRFPIAVPSACFADYHRESGSGLIITERINFGQGAIEPHRGKCLDHHTLPDPLPYYSAIVTALARLAAAHKAGRLDSDIAARFPFDPTHGSADPILYSETQLRAELARCFDFARRCPNLLPAEVRTEAFFAQMERDALRIREHEGAIQRYLTGNPNLIALCHWNAHIDNCWFWTGEDDALHCGLIDWGRAGQITLGSALWGGLSAAHHDIWDSHLDRLLQLFVDEYRAHGGPKITRDELEFHLTLHMAAMGIARVLAFPEIIMFRLPECVDASDPQDPMFEAVEPARCCAHVYRNFLKFWQKHDFGEALDQLLERAG